MQKPVSLNDGGKNLWAPVGAKRRENFAGISFAASDWSNARDHNDPLSNDNLTG